MSLRTLLKLIIPIVSLSVIACSSIGDPAPTQVPCEGSTDCKIYKKYPACGDPTSSMCDFNLINNEGKPGVCAYRLNVSLSSCTCVANTVQYCGNGFGGDGSTQVQDCIQNGGAQATSWGGCHN
jgi:hypothetical protein